jgi:hypothetical protein
VSPPPAPVVTPPPPPAPVRPLAVHRRPRHHRRHVAAKAAPAPTIPHGLPPRLDDRGFASPPLRLVDQTEPVAAVAAPAPRSASATVFLLAAAGLGLLLLIASLLPAEALRPAPVYHAVVFHRMNLGLVGSAILLLVVILRLAVG